MKISKILNALTMTALCGGVFVSGVCAQVESSSSSSSSSTTEATVKGYAFKYKQRFENYAGQIDMGVTKGWLTAAQAETFKTRLAELRSAEAAAGQAGYPDAEIAKLDKLTTKFNEDLSSASQNTSSSATAGGSGAAKSADTQVKSSAKTTKTKTTTTKKSK